MQIIDEPAQLLVKRGRSQIISGEQRQYWGTS